MIRTLLILYEKFGFVTCAAKTYLSIPVHHLERIVDRYTISSAWRVRSFSQADLPAMVAVYNAVHAHRPWTYERQTNWNRLLDTQTWQLGSEVIIRERHARLAGYALYTDTRTVSWGGASEY